MEVVEVPMQSTLQSRDEIAADYRRQARGERRRAKKDAQYAAEWYAAAERNYRFAAWLTQRPEIWTENGTPAQREELARGYANLGDIFLRSSANYTRMSRFYFGLARHYERAVV
jgi:hypothetical protein